MCRVPVHPGGFPGCLHASWLAGKAARSVNLGEPVQKAPERIDAVEQKVITFQWLPRFSGFTCQARSVGPAFQWISSRVSIRPLVTINSNTGKIDPIGVVRTKKSMLDKIYKHFKTNVQSGLRLHVAVIQGAAQQEAKFLVERIREELKPVELIVTSTGPVLGLHTGPGTVGICGYCEQEH